MSKLQITCIESSTEPLTKAMRVHELRYTVITGKLHQLSSHKKISEDIGNKDIIDIDDFHSLFSKRGH